MKFIHTEYKLSFKLRDLNPRSRPAVNRISLVWQFVNIQGNVLKYYIGLHENETLKERKKCLPQFQNLFRRIPVS